MSSNPEEPDVVDVFSQILTQDDRSHASGLEEGQRDGSVSGYVEGFSFGWAKGWEIGMEIGFYRTYSKLAQDHYLLPQKQAHDSSPRKLQSITQLMEVLDRIDLGNVKADSLSEDIVLARRKFKQLFPGVYKLKGDSDHSTSF